MKHVVHGVIAGAAGTTMLNLVSYLDMLLRGRAPSSLPGEVAADLAQRVGISLGPASQAATVQHRKEALGALLGIDVGLTLGAAMPVIDGALGRAPLLVRGLIVGGLAMAASDVPAALLGKSNPKSWPVSSWISDIVPHLAYGLVTVASYEALRAAWQDR